MTETKINGKIVLENQWWIDKETGEPLANMPVVEQKEYIDISFLNNMPIGDKIKLLAKAIGHDETRFYMNGLHVENNGDHTVFSCTDGKRLHQWKTDKMIEVPTGLYEIIKSGTKLQGLKLIKEPGNYPNVENVKPKEVQTIGQYDFGYKKTDKGFSVSICRLIIDSKAIFNLNFLYDLIGFTWTVSGTVKDGKINPEKQIVFESDDLYCIIMPIG